jgi:hypothetical protein
VTTTNCIYDPLARLSFPSRLRNPRLRLQINLPLTNNDLPSSHPLRNDDWFKVTRTWISIPLSRFQFGLHLQSEVLSRLVLSFEVVETSPRKPSDVRNLLERSKKSIPLRTRKKTNSTSSVHARKQNYRLRLLCAPFLVRHRPRFPETTVPLLE